MLKKEDTIKQLSCIYINYNRDREVQMLGMLNYLRDTIFKLCIQYPQSESRSGTTRTCNDNEMVTATTSSVVHHIAIWRRASMDEFKGGDIR